MIFLPSLFLINIVKVKISIMVNIKEMKEHDFIFVSKPLTAKEEKEFSDFLKDRKSRLKVKRNFRFATDTIKVTA